MGRETGPWKSQTAEPSSGTKVQGASSPVPRPGADPFERTGTGPVGGQ